MQLSFERGRNGRIEENEVIELCKEVCQPSRVQEGKVVCFFQELSKFLWTTQLNHREVEGRCHMTSACFTAT